MPQMMKRAFQMMGLVAGLLLGAPAPAWADNAACTAAIRGAVAHRASVPAACWRVGPLTLGMTRRAAEEALGPPDQTGRRTILSRRRRTRLDTALYVFPRNLRNWLTLAPAAREDFHPATLRLAYAGDRLTAIAFGRSARIDFPACASRRNPDAGYQRGDADFPADFNGIGLEASLQQVTAAFGPFATHNRSRDFWTYDPLPIAVTGDDRVQEIGIATDAAMVGALGPAHLAASLEPASCRVSGFSVRN